MTGDMHSRYGVCVAGACMAGACLVGAWQGGNVWQGGMHGRGGGHAWHGACVANGNTAIFEGGMHPTGMHSFF